jgi:indolepyruvate ferredoxin oxidoreductase
MQHGFRLLAALKGLRGTPLDIFGYMNERKAERRFLDQYQADVDMVVAGLTPAKLEAAVALASLPSLARGFGHVKEANMKAAESERRRLWERWSMPVETVGAEAAEKLVRTAI